MSASTASLDRPRLRVRVLRAALAVAAAIGLSCSGSDGFGVDSVLRGRVWLGGPVAGARVEAYQLVDGERTRRLDDAVTGPGGEFELTVDGYQHFELIAAGGSYDEGGEPIVLPAGQVLRGAVLEVGTGSERADLAITPFTDVMIELARARAARGEPFNQALTLVHDRLEAHLGFDPTATAIGDLSGPLPANADASQHALLLAGLRTEAATAAADLRVSVQDVSTLSFLRALIADAASSEARLDGNIDGAAAPLHVGGSCPDDAPGARASCRVTSNTLRARLAAGVLSDLVGADNQTGLGRSDVLAWVTAIATSTDAELFGGDPPERIDRTPPRVTWISPAADARLAGVVGIEVRADDELGIDSIVVAAITAGADPDVLITVSDSDPSPARFAGDLIVSGLPEGAIQLRATAADVSGEVTTSFLPVVIDEIHGGTISGVVVKGRVDGATVRVHRYDGGVRGALLGQGVTAADGTFTSVAIADGYTGPLLIEAGFGGSYREEAGPATVTLDVADALRTIVPAYTDGAAPSSVVVTPLTTFAVTYRELLAGAGLGGVTVAEQWQTAATAMETHFGVANLRTLAPLAPEAMGSLTAGARYGLVMIGLSELARRASTLGGGDAGTFGVAASSIAVERLWQQDLADGCWNGRAGAAADGPRLFYGGTQALGDDPTRRALANAIAGYLDSPRNATPFAGVADVLPLLDALSTGGGAIAPGNCGALPGQPGTGTLVVGAGEGFDQLAPVIAIAPAEGAVVRGSVLITALATDNLDLRPTLVFTAPAALAGQDLDGDTADADARATLDTMAVVGAEGPIAISLESEDDAGGIGTAIRHLVVDNVPPLLSITGVVDGAAYPPPHTITYAVVESHPAGLTATLDGAPFVSGAAVIAPGLHTIALAASDQAGNTAALARTFRIDGAAPALTVTGVTDGAVLAPPVTITFAAADDDLATASATLDNAPFVSGAAVVTEGSHTLIVSAVDHAGNHASLARTFIVDGTPPAIIIAGVVTGGVYGPPRTITFDAGDANLLSVTATLDGAAFVSGAAVSLEGDHTLIVTARDRADNAAQVTRTFTIDGTPPLVSVIGVVAGGFHVPPVTITFAAMDPTLASVAATLDGMPFSSGGVVAAEGPHQVRVIAIDRAGNQTVVDRAFVLDGTAPVVTITGVAAGGIHAPPRTITFDAVDANPASLTATLDGAPFVSGAAVSSEGDHTLRVTAIDRAGNQTQLVRVFTIDGTAPVVSIAGVNAGGFHVPPVTITYAAVDAHLDTVAATLDGAPFASGAPVAAEGPHTLRVTAIDRAGNQTVVNRAFTLDGTPPLLTIVGVVSGGVHAPPRTITFDATDTNLLSVAGVLDGAPFATGAAVATEGAHTLIVTALDRAGNQTQITRVFTIDGTPPQVVIAGVDAGGFHAPPVTITFSASDAHPGTVGATLDGAPFGSGSAVVAEGAHTLIVTARDGAGNQTVVTRDFIVDGTRPAVTIVGVADGGAYRSPRQITYDATDVNLASVAATLTHATDPARPFASGASAIAADAGADVLRVTAIDRAGNQTVVSIAFVIDDAAPVITIGAVAEGAFYQPPARPTFAAADLTLATVSATLDGAPFASGADVVASGPHTLVVDAADRAGNTARTTIHFTVDGIAPVLTLDATGLTSYDGVLWTTAASPDLSVDATDLNLLDVRALVGAAVVATDQDGQAPWRLTIPAGTIPVATDLAIDLVARDRAGNTTTVSRRFRYDATAPVVTMQNTSVRNERNDLVSFTPQLDPDDLRVNHAHNGAAITLGPPTACDGTAPTVSKYAYLLDAAMPMYVSETAPTNPFAWAFTTADDGIGVDPAAVAYRVRDVGADQVVLDWAPLTTPIAGSYGVTLYRNGGAQPSIPALGTRAGRYELQIRSVDRAGRASVVTRCWNHDPLAAPLRIDAAQAATHGPAGSNKYALNLLALDDTTAPIDPIAAQVLSDPFVPGDLRSGSGLMQFAVRNPSTETVFLTIDLTRPQGATYSKTQVLGKVVADDEAGTADCGPAVDDLGDALAPDTSLSYCTVGALALSGGAVSSTGVVPIPTPPEYGVRVWEQVTPSNFVELTTNCPEPGCTQTLAGKVRLTVSLPPRQVHPLGGILPARIFWVVPVVKAIDALRPDIGPFSELTASGNTYTGKLISSTRRCRVALNSFAGRWRCTAKRTYRNFNALTQAKFTLPNETRSSVAVSVDGINPMAPPHINIAERNLFVATWSTAEPIGF